MARKIKFRAWDKAEKKMLFRNLHDRNWYYHPVECHTARSAMPNDERTIECMQSTGLKDKNGKEIYEGDLVKWGENIESVSYNETTASFETETSCLDSDSFEVIGNIYETPELAE